MAGDEGGSDGGGGAGGSDPGVGSRDPLPHLDDMFGDRPVSVPVGKVRNRRASGHAPVSPMVAGSGHGSWSSERAATAPSKATSLPQLAAAQR